MQELTREDLYSLERYAELRSDFRSRVMAHKRDRRLALGEHVVLYFEDRLTMQYQVQEMLRAERIFEPAGIQEELDAYNPLIPRGRDWRATMMVEYADVEERRRELTRLIGVEDRAWMRVAGFEPVYAIADEDLDRDTAEKTSAVHFVRFDLSAEMAAAAKSGAALAAGVDHERYSVTVDPIPDPVRRSLVNDLD